MMHALTAKLLDVSSARVKVTTLIKARPAEPPLAPELGEAIQSIQRLAQAIGDAIYLEPTTPVDPLLAGVQDQKLALSRLADGLHEPGVTEIITSAHHFADVLIELAHFWRDHQEEIVAAWRRQPPPDPLAQLS